MGRSLLIADHLSVRIRCFVQRVITLCLVVRSLRRINELSLKFSMDSHGHDLHRQLDLISQTVIEISWLRQLTQDGE